MSGYMYLLAVNNRLSLLHLKFNQWQRLHLQSAQWQCCRQSTTNLLNNGSSLTCQSWLKCMEGLDLMTDYPCSLSFIYHYVLTSHHFVDVAIWPQNKKGHYNSARRLPLKMQRVWALLCNKTCQMTQICLLHYDKNLDGHNWSKTSMWQWQSDRTGGICQA